MKMNNIKTEGGFTLIEMLITLVISSILMAGIYSAFKTQQDSYVAQDQVVEAQQNIRAGLFVLTREIRMAGFDPTSHAGAGITSATRSRLVFTRDDNLNESIDANETIGLGFSAVIDSNSDGVVDGGGVASLGMKVGAGPFEPVTDNIQAVEFSYRLSDGTQTFAPTTTQLFDIQSVQISILARADRPDRNFTDRHTYTLDSGTIWGPFNDHYRRRSQSVTIALPNMGL